MHYDHAQASGARLEAEPDLRDLADFSTCAVVGSSSTLKGSGQGHEIDSHTAIIRFNDAPTKSYQVSQLAYPASPPVKLKARNIFQFYLLFYGLLRGR